jgi:16S rRNA (cytidine1402-2'-O)-methyltransferase
MATLYVVGTPIGNLGDITLRAVEVLKQVDTVFCEDTRVTGKLLKHIGSEAKLKRCDAHKELACIELIHELIQEGKDVALVSDAGTPAISDPGVRVVAGARERDIAIEVVPGPSALSAALSVAGVLAPEFVFLGFLPHKKGREKIFNEITESERAMVFYESPHRIVKTLEALAEKLTDEHSVTIARELTKIHEEVVTKSAKEMLVYFTDNPDKVRGEFVVIVSPH